MWNAVLPGRLSLVVVALADLRAVPKLAHRFVVAPMQKRGALCVRGGVWCKVRQGAVVE
jgi:hypothetical protein